MSPFVRMTQWHDGRLNTCTHYRETWNDGWRPNDENIEVEDFIPNGKYKTLQEAFEGEEMEELRQKMINGEWLDGCRYCYHLENLGLMSLRQSINSSHEISHEKKIKELELYPSNKCNFRCSICNSSVSSVWEKQPFHEKFYSNPLEKSKYEYCLDGIKTDDLTLLTISGGEPMIMNQYDETFFKSNFDFDNLFFTMATNNSLFPKKYFLDFLSKCKEILIYLSLDGVGEVGEFVRKGMKMKMFEKNLLKWQSWFKNSKFKNKGNDYKLRPPFLTGLRTMYVLQTYNVFNTYDTFKFMEKNDMLETFDLRNCYAPECLNIAYLPDIVKEDIVKEITFYNDYHKDFIMKILNSSKYKKDYMIEFIEYTNYLMVLSEIPEECLRIYKKCLRTI